MIGQDGLLAFDRLAVPRTILPVRGHYHPLFAQRMPSFFPSHTLELDSRAELHRARIEHFGGFANVPVSQTRGDRARVQIGIESHIDSARVRIAVGRDAVHIVAVAVATLTVRVHFRLAGLNIDERYLSLRDYSSTWISHCAFNGSPELGLRRIGKSQNEQ